MKRIILVVSLGVVLLLAMIWASSLGPPAQVGVGLVQAATTPVSVENIVLTGLTPPTMTIASSDADGNTFVNDGRTFLYISNAYTATLTVTVVTPRTVNGLDVDDLTVSVTADNDYSAIGPFLPETFNNSSGKCQVTWATGGEGLLTSITFAVLRW